MPEEQSIVKEVGAVTQHQVSKELSEHSQNLSDIEMPFRVENVTMMSPGTWNGKDYRPEEIKQAYNRTNWEDPDVKSLFNEHDDHDSRDWIGEIKNPRMDGDELVADMDIVTADEARKVAYGARFGISPKVSGRDRADVMQDFGYDNFSLVLDPAVKTTYLNSEHNTDDDNDKPGVKNVMVKSTMSEEDSKELSDEDVAKVEEIVSTVENSDVKELANVIAPFVGDASAEQVQPVVEDVVENAEDEESESDEEEEMSGYKEEEEMRMEEIARKAAEMVAQEMSDDDGEDDGGDEGDSAEESLSVDEIADKVAEKVQVENSDDEEEEDSSEEVDALKEELSEIKEQLSNDEEDKTTIENKTPNPGSESTGMDSSDSKDVAEMSDEEIDRGAAKYMLKKQSRRV